MADVPLEELRRRYLAGSDPLAYLPYGSALLDERQLTQALDVCLRGLDVRPSFAGRRLLAQIYFEMGRYPQAVEVLQAMLAEGRESFAALLLLARTYSRCGRWSDCQPLLERLNRLNSADPEVILLQQQAREAFERSQQLTPVEADSAPHVVDPKSLASQPGVGMSFVLRPSESGNVLEASEIEALLSLILGKSDQIVKALRLGTFQELMMEYEQGYLLARRSGEDFLVAKFERSLPPGRMRQVMGRLVARKG